MNNPYQRILQHEQQAAKYQTDAINYAFQANPVESEICKLRAKAEWDKAQAIRKGITS